MLKLGKLTDYAITVMVALAQGGAMNGTQARSAGFLSQDTDIPEPTVAKVLKTLSRGHLVRAARGVSGGYSLTRPAAEISIADIIEAIDGPIAIVSCLEKIETSCCAESKCPARGKWDPINQSIRTALSGVTLADFAKPQKQRIYQISKQEDRHADAS